MNITYTNFRFNNINTPDQTHVIHCVLKMSFAANPMVFENCDCYNREACSKFPSYFFMSELGCLNENLNLGVKTLFKMKRIQQSHHHLQHCLLLLQKPKHPVPLLLSLQRPLPSLTVSKISENFETSQECFLFYKFRLVPKTCVRLVRMVSMQCHMWKWNT